MFVFFFKLKKYFFSFFRNCSERLENIAIQCCKHCEKEFGENFGWNEERSKMLKQQILNFVNPEEPVRKIASKRNFNLIGKNNLFLSDKNL